MAWAANYDDRQREAIAVARVDLGLSAPEIVELAASGDLELRGERLEPFTASASSVKRIGTRYERQQLGLERSPLEDLDAGDAVEQLRRRLVRAVDYESRQVVKRQKRGEPASGEELRQLGRALRELASIPGRNDPRPPAPGQRELGTGKRASGATRGGLGAKILDSHRSGGLASPAPPEPAPTPEPEPQPELDLRERARAGIRAALEPLIAEAERREQEAAETGTPPPPPPPVHHEPTLMSSPHVHEQAGGWRPAPGPRDELRRRKRAPEVDDSSEGR